MVYYLLVGDEFGSPPKFKTFIGEDIRLIFALPVERIKLDKSSMNVY